MRNKSVRSFLVFACLAATAILTTPAPAAAQSTNTPAVSTQQTFVETAQLYLTSQNTNFDFNDTLEVATGYKQVTGANAASTLDAEFNIRTNINIGAALQFSGVGSPVNAFEVQGGYAVINRSDVKVEADLRAGYDWNVKAAVFEPGIFLKKKATPNTFFEIGVSLPVYTRGTFNRNPTFFAETGFTWK